MHRAIFTRPSQIKVRSTEPNTVRQIVVDPALAEYGSRICLRDQDPASASRRSRHHAYEGRVVALALI